MDVRAVAALQGDERDLRAVWGSKNVGSLRSPRHFAPSLCVGFQCSVARPLRGYHQVRGRDPRWCQAAMQRV
eukprot:15465595-Alexandrium_andersonii.AAC.1